MRRYAEFRITARLAGVVDAFNMRFERTREDLQLNWFPLDLGYGVEKR